MENRERIVELLLGLIFICILLLGVFIVMNEPNKKSSSSNSVSNSYNTYNYNYQDQTKRTGYESSRDVIYVKDVHHLGTYHHYKDYDYKDRDYYDYYSRNERSLRYSSYGKHTREKDFAGSYVDEFKVYVKNQDRKNGYFKVKFYFEDYDGNEFTETVTKYIRAGEREEIRFIDVQFEKYKYHDWRYKVIPDTKSSKRTGFDYVYY